MQLEQQQAWDNSSFSRKSVTVITLIDNKFFLMSIVSFVLFLYVPPSVPKSRVHHLPLLPLLWELQSSY